MIDQTLELYSSAVLGSDQQALAVQEHAYGGVVRAAKGKLVEDISELVLKQAWTNTGGEPDRIEFSKMKYKIPIREENIASLPQPIQEEIKAEKERFFYRLGVDTHVCIDNKFVLGVECKAYTENAMLKRILTDFRLLKTRFPDLVCCLLQLETFLGGKNTMPSIESPIANKSTYTLMSYFPDVDLHIMTLLEGSRNIRKPIHKPEHYKTLKREYVEHAVDRFTELLLPFARIANS